MLDIKIIGGTVIDGSGKKGYIADVGIKGDRIVKIGNLSEEEAKQVVSAEGLIVSPGFIDVHTHSDLSVIYDNKVSSKIHDGVTTEVIGNCGIGVAPICDERKQDLIAYLGTRLIGTIPVTLELPWNTMKEYLDTVEAHLPATNIVPLVSQGAIRINEMGFSKSKPTPEQMENMKREVKIAIEEGCAGLSSGLMYMPGEYSTVDELGELCSVLAPYDSFYVSHIRNEGEQAMEAWDEAIAIARKGNTALHVSHVKLSGASVWGRTNEIFEKYEDARNSGLVVTFDVYPYATGCTSLGTCMPPWTFEGGTQKMLERIQDKDVRKRIVSEIKSGLDGWQNPLKVCVTWDRITFASAVTEEGKKMIGKTIAQVCEETGYDPYELIFDTLIREEGRVQILPAMMSQKDVDTIVSHPNSMVGSDGMSLSTEGILSTGNPHPRAFGTHGRLFAYFVRERGLLTLEEAVKKVTALPAERMRLDQRGLLKEGYYADVTVFSPEKIQDMATYINPKQYTKGIRLVVVNGQIALKDDIQTDVTNGRVLRIKRNREGL